MQCSSSGVTGLPNGNNSLCLPELCQPRSARGRGSPAHNSRIVGLTAAARACGWMGVVAECLTEPSALAESDVSYPRSRNLLRCYKQPPTSLLNFWPFLPSAIAWNMVFSSALRRYGFIVGYIALPRINPHQLCAANHTGVYRLSTNTTGRYDAYCYNTTGMDMLLWRVLGIN